MEKILEQLTAYGNSDAYPFHMPGHKRRSGEEASFWREYFLRDITEIDGFDNLHHADGLLKNAMNRAAKLYHSEQTYYLVNGSTGGVLAAILAAVPEKGSLIMQRKSHQSAYHALMLKGLRGIYLSSETDTKTGIELNVTAKQVLSLAKRYPQAGAVFLTSPTYEGFSAPLREIADGLHQMGKCLIVDAAHGAHFGMADFLPENAVAAGADMVIHSLHKTLPAPTQTALLHVNSDRIDIAKVERYLSVFQSSSPSYVLMAGIDQCIWTMKEHGRELMADFYQRRKILSQQLTGLKHICVIDAFSPLQADTEYLPEMGKMLLVPAKEYMTARELYDILRLEYQLQPEMASKDYVLLFLTVMDTDEGYQRLAEALFEIDKTLDHAASENNKKNNNVAAINKKKTANTKLSENIFPEAVYTISDACAMRGEWIPAKEAEGRISKEFVMVYPPGQPLLAPGERITEQVLYELAQYRENGCEIIGIRSPGLNNSECEKSAIRCTNKTCGTYELMCIVGAGCDPSV